MATGTQSLTLKDFRLRYSEEKPAYEYWFGEAVQKAVGTWLHGVLQIILCELFRQAGYKASPEVELRIDPDWQPKPDVAAAVQVEGPYPTKPVEIVAEVLSPEDKMARVFEKCRQYERIGIAKVFVFDPEAETAWEWSRELRNLERIEELRLPNGAQIRVQTVWEELRLRK